MGFLIIVIGEDYLIFYKSYLHSTLFSFFVSAILHQFQVLSGVKLILFKNHENKGPSEFCSFCKSVWKKKW